MFGAPPMMRRGGPHYRGGGRRDGGHYALLLLFGQISQVGIKHIPPVTLGILGTCITLFLQIIPITRNLHSGNMCFDVQTLNVALASGRGFAKPLRNLFLGPLFHASDWHLYYNMVSWMYKGRAYERFLRSSEAMAVWVVLATLCTGIMYVAVCWGAALLLAATTTSGGGGDHFGRGANYDEYYEEESSFLPGFIAGWLAQHDACVIGFSGVLFCLKTVMNCKNAEMLDFEGGRGAEDVDVLQQFLPFLGGIFRTPLRHAVWVELIIIQIITPYVAFLGHMAGILTGLLFIALHVEETIVRPLGDFIHNTITKPIAEGIQQQQQQGHRQPQPMRPEERFAR